MCLLHNVESIFISLLIYALLRQAWPLLNRCSCIRPQLQLVLLETHPETTAFKSSNYCKM